MLLSLFAMQALGVVTGQGIDWQMLLVVIVGVLARAGGMLLAGGMRLFPGVTVGLRLGIVVVVSVAAVPAAVLATQRGAAVNSLDLIPTLIAELLVGCGLGLAVALLVSVAEMAGSMLASVAGLNWADAFTPGGSSGPGVARLCGWLGLAAFVAAGGQQAAVAGLLDSFWTLPVGQASAPGDAFGSPFLEWLIHLPAVCLGLAFAVALPVLVAVVTTHVAAAICLRSVAFTPGPGLLQGVAAVVLLGGLIAGSQQWSGGIGRVMMKPLEATFESIASPAKQEPAAASGHGFFPREERP
jgi:flagellar biosynthesis protein FliR